MILKIPPMNKDDMNTEMPPIIDIVSPSQRPTKNVKIPIRNKITQVNPRAEPIKPRPSEGLVACNPFWWLFSISINVFANPMSVSVEINSDDFSSPFVHLSILFEQLLHTLKDFSFKTQSLYVKNSYFITTTITL